MNDNYAIRATHSRQEPWYYTGKPRGAADRWTHTPVAFSLAQASRDLQRLAVLRDDAAEHVSVYFTMVIVPVELAPPADAWEPLTDPQNFGFVVEGDDTNVDHFGKAGWWGVLSRRVPAPAVWREVKHDG